MTTITINLSDLKDYKQEEVLEAWGYTTIYPDTVEHAENKIGPIAIIEKEA